MRIKKSNFAFFISFIFLTLILPYKAGQIITLTAAFIVAISYLYSLYIKKSIKIVRNTDDLKLACKEKAEISFTIKNFSRLPVFTIYFLDNAPFFYVYGGENKGLIALRPYEVKKVSYYVSMQDRGEYVIGPVNIKTSDPLGLFPINLDIESKINVMVRPARIKLITETAPGFPQGHLKIQNICYEDITMRRSIREYKNGDEQKRINWRASARFGQLFTNQYEASYDVPFFVFLNLAEDDYDLNDLHYYTEKAIEIAACIVERSRYLRQQIGFAAYGSGFPYLRPKANQADAILDILSTIKIEPGNLKYNPEIQYKNQLQAGTLIFVIGPAEVRKYFSMVEAEKQNINTENVGIMRVTNARK